MSFISRERWQALSPLLDQALELDATARSEFVAQLAQRAPEDAALLATLLRDHDTSWLRTGVTPPGATGHTVGGAKPVSAGEVLGAWRLVRSLGEGGMGSVWLAERADGHFDGRAAIKLLHATLLRGEGAARFRREGQVLARLTHPGIARLFDAGMTRHGQPYLVLEFVEGAPIDVWCKSRGLDLPQRLRLFDQVLMAVAHAHAHGIVHRDLKPSNVFVSDDGVVKLLDFGIAQLEAEGQVEGAQPYTPRYAAPEQIRRAAVTIATDIYSLGVLGYELLAGTHPTPAPTLDRDAVEAAIVSTAPAPLPPHVPRDVDAILRRALAKEPSARYATVQAMADDLERWRRHEPVTARAGGQLYRLRRFAVRHRGAVVAATLLLVGLSGAAITSRAQALRAARERDAALVAERRARVMSEVLLGTLASPPSSDSVGAVTRSVEWTRAQLDNHFAHDDREHARLAIDLSRVFSLVEREREANLLLVDALERAQRLDDDALIAESLCRLRPSEQTADSLRLEARVDRLAIGDQRAMRALATCHMWKAEELLMDNERRPEAKPLAASAIALAREAADTTSLFFAELLVSEAQVLHWSGGQVAEQHAANRRLMAAYERLGLSSSLPAFRLVVPLAASLRSNGWMREADSLVRAVVDPFETGDRWRSLPPMLLLERALAAGYMGRADEAAAWFDRVLAATDLPGHASVRFNTRVMAVILLARAGRLADARVQLDSLESAVARGADAAQAVNAVRARAEFALAEGRAASAVRLLDSLARARGYPAWPRTLEAPALLRQLAEAQWAAGDPGAAREAALVVMRVLVRDTLRVRHSEHVGAMQVLLGRIAAAEGDTAVAAPLVRIGHQTLRSALGAEHAMTRDAERLLGVLQPQRTAMATPALSAR